MTTPDDEARLARIRGHHDTKCDPQKFDDCFLLALIDKQAKRLAKCREAAFDAMCDRKCKCCTSVATAINAATQDEEPGT